MPKKKTTKRKTTKKKAKKKKATKTTMVGTRVNGLPAKQFMFCQEYLVDLCAKEAARRAGYSEKTCEQIGWQLIQKPEVKNAIELLIEQRANRVGVHADRVVKELSTIAFADITDALSFDNNGIVIKPSKSMKEKTRRAIGEVRQTVSMSGGSISFKMHSKIEALKTLAQHLGMTKQEVEHTVKDEAKVIFFPSNGREVEQGE